MYIYIYIYICVGVRQYARYVNVINVITASGYASDMIRGTHHVITLSVKLGEGGLGAGACIYYRHLYTCSCAAHYYVDNIQQHMYNVYSVHMIHVYTCERVRDNRCMCAIICNLSLSLSLYIYIYIYIYMYVYIYIYIIFMCMHTHAL